MSVVEAPVDARMRPALERAVRYRFLALLLEPPRAGRQETLRALAREARFGGELDLTPALAPDDAAVEVEHFRLLGEAGRVSCAASAYVREGFADKGPILGDIAGFYRAFGWTPPCRETPDHFANLFAFLAFLTLKEAYAAHREDTEEAEVARDAEAKLLSRHVHPYLGRFAERLRDHAPEGGIFQVAAALATGLSEEGGESLPE